MYSFGENRSPPQQTQGTNQMANTTNGSNVSSAPNTPVSLPSQSTPFFDVNYHGEDSLWEAQGSKRCPTFKDYAEKVKQLQQENFQLRVRIFMNEQKTGVKTCSSDFATLFQQNYHQLQSAFHAHNVANNPAHSTTASSFTASNDHQSNLTSLKTRNDQLQSTLGNMEAKVHNLEKALNEKQTENDKLLDKYNDVQIRLQEMETELALNRVKLQHQNNQVKIKSHEEEVERAARIAFGSFDDDVGDSNRHDLEVKLKEENSKIQDLEKKVSKMQKDIEKYQKSITILEKEKKEADSKLVECSKALMEFGKKNAQLEREVEGLQSTIKQQQRSINDSKAVDSIVVRKFSSIKQSASLLQNRLFEIINFIETLFTLESKKVLTLTGLNDSNRKSLRIAVEQCRLHSHSLDELLKHSEPESELSRKLNNSGSKLDQELTFNSHRYSFNDSVFGSNRKPGKSVSVQVDLLSSRSKKEAELVESVKRLTLEQTSKIAQIASLESRLRSATDHIASLENSSRTISNQAYEALQTENKTLNTRVRVTESALLKLHQQHAKIVGELKELRHSHAECFQDKETTDRPSDSTSPDLGIDSGHDGAVNSDDSNSSNNYKAENRALRNANRELAHKLNDTRKILNNTLEKLHTTSKQKEQVEKAICRQLHKTHTILRQAKKSVEIYTAANSQENHKNYKLLTFVQPNHLSTMGKITVELIRKRAEHNEGEIHSLEELALHQEKLEKIELVDKICRKLKILLLQNNAIGKIENLSRLKEMEYLNLALNSVERVENLEGCESLKKLDLTLNFVGELTSLRSLRHNYNLEQLYLVGNPCHDYPGYREYMITILPQLKQLDGSDITRSERIKARQNFQEVKAMVLASQEAYLREKNQHRTSELSNMRSMGGGGDEGNMIGNFEDKDKVEDDLVDEEAYWSKVTGNTPESRLEMCRMLELQEKKKSGVKEDKPKKVRRYFDKDDQPLSCNEPKLSFTLNDDMERNVITLDLAVPRHMCTTMIDADVQPNYVRVTIKGKIFQLRLSEEVKPDSSYAQRSQTTGHLIITMPKVHQNSVLVWKGTNSQVVDLTTKSEGSSQDKISNINRRNTKEINDGKKACQNKLVKKKVRDTDSTTQSEMTDSSLLEYDVPPLIDG